MKVITIGTGPRLVEVANALVQRHTSVVAVTSDEGAARNGFLRRVGLRRTPLEGLDLRQLDLAVGREDVVVVCHDESKTVQELLSRLQEQGVDSQVLVFTSADVRELRKTFPQVSFRSDDSLYRGELAGFLRKVDTIHRVERLKELVMDRAKLLILLYANPDPDALGCAMALKALLGRTQESCTIAYTGDIARVENMAMMRILRIRAEKFDPGMLASHDALAVVDGQPSFFDLDPVPHFDIVIDHHPRGKGYRAGFTDVRPRYGATATILTEYFTQSGEKIPKLVATALYYAIKVDTGTFERQAHDEDILAFKHLHGLMDKQLLHRIEYSQYTLSTLDYFGIALLRKRTERDVLFVHVGAVPSTDTVVHIADFFNRLSEMRLVVVSGVTPDRLAVVFRTKGTKKGVGSLAKRGFGDLGSAGGHAAMARAEVPVERLREHVPDLSTERVEFFVLERLVSHLRPLRRILEAIRPPDGAENSKGA